MRWPISAVLLSTGLHVSGITSAEATVAHEAIDEPIFTMLIARLIKRYGDDDVAILREVALGAFRCGMIYARAIDAKPQGDTTPDETTKH